jgi:hypothetical protein
MDIEWERSQAHLGQRGVNDTATIGRRGRPAEDDALTLDECA